LTYRLTAQSVGLYSYLFEVDNQTGDIRVHGTLDYEAHTVYQLGVVAQDHGPDSLPVDVVVIVRVIDINDNAPVISLSTLASRRTSSADVFENIHAGSFVAHVGYTKFF